jgi:hypothetical protein
VDDAAQAGEAMTIGPVVRAGGVGCRLLGVVSCALLLCLLGASAAAASPAWLPVTNLSAPGKDAFNPAVAMDGAGGTVAIWERQNATAHDLQVSTRAPGGNFSAPLELAPTANEPEVATTPSGEAVAVWRHFDAGSGNYVIQTSTRFPGGSFSVPTEISISKASALPQSLRVAVNAAGEVAVAWVQKDPDSALDPDQFFVEASVRPAGGSFSVPAVVSPSPLTPGDGATGPGVALDGAGDVFVVWEYFDGTDHLVQAAVGSPGGGFAPPLSLSPGGTDAFSPQVAADAGGDATAVWTQSDGADFIVQASTRPAGGSFSAPGGLSEAGVDALAPEIAMTPSGAATVAWTLSSGSETLLQAVARAAGGSFSPLEDVSTPGESALFPDLAMNAGGDAAIAWSGSVGGEDVVRASIRPDGGSFSPPLAISATGSGFFHPALALDEAGDATAVWTRSDGSNEIAQAAGYDADAPRLRDVSIPTSGTVGVPVAFSASSFDAWPIASTSFDFGDGSAAAGSTAFHVYSAPGVFRVAVTAADAAGTSVESEGTIAIRPSGEFSLGKVSVDKKKGTATIVVTVSGPGKLVLFGKGVRKAVRRVAAAGKTKLPIAATGKTLKRLKARGRVRVRLQISFTPDGGAAAVMHKSAVLIKKR